MSAAEMGRNAPVPEPFEEWAVLELMGHRRLAGRISEQEIAGQKFLRIDIPAPQGPVTQFYSASAVYAITPTVEAIARELASQISATPISRFDVPNLLPPPRLRATEDQ